MRLLEPNAAQEADILLAHSPEYLEQVKAVSKTGGFLAEATYLSPESYNAALFSAGAAIFAASGVLEKRFDTALSLGRPPGHHAGIAHAGGFCLFNNAAVAAKYCLEKGLCRRVLIIDWDLHHGDGTQEIVQHDPRIIFCSLHQFGPELYPESGDLEESGTHGNIVNVPLPAKIGDEAYLEVFRAVVPNLIRQSQPDLVIVCAGFDGHFNDVNHLYLYDPGAGFCLTPALYHTLTSIVAHETAAINTPYVVILEGGYDLTNLSNSLVNTAAAMLNLPPLVSLAPYTELDMLDDFDVKGYVAKLNTAHRYRWQFGG
jgi:acetoin utilization deacetylase AcuC-like enzyme